MKEKIIEKLPANIMSTTGLSIVYDLSIHWMAL